MQNTNIKPEAITLTVKDYLRRNNYELVDTIQAPARPTTFVIKDNEYNELVLANVEVRGGDKKLIKISDEFVTTEASTEEIRDKFEDELINYFTEHSDICNTKVRGDRISIIILNGDKVLVRHHINITGIK